MTGALAAHAALWHGFLKLGSGLESDCGADDIESAEFLEGFELREAGIRDLGRLEIENAEIGKARDGESCLVVEAGAGYIQRNEGFEAGEGGETGRSDF